MRVRTLLTAIAAALLVLLILIGINGIFNIFDFGDTGVKTSSHVVMHGPAKIVRLEPIALDCRTTVYSRVPVRGQKDHVYEVLGVPVAPTRTDHAGMTAYGDVDVCVKSDLTTIEVTPEGAWEVKIAVEDIVFHRPRLDMILTQGSIWYDAGWQADFSDHGIVGLFVDEDEDLTPAMTAYAQSVVGSTECYQASWDATLRVLKESYRNQAIETGIDPETVTVTVDGKPDFKKLSASALAGYSSEQVADMEAIMAQFHFEVEDDGIECELSAELYEQELKAAKEETPTDT